MKKIYSLIFASAFTLASLSSSAATIPVLVGANSSGVPSNVFTPSAITCNVGDIVNFVLASTIAHNVTSTSVPSGAAAMSSGTMSTLGQMYAYTVTVAGAYAFSCTFHAGMNGTINAAATGVAEVATDLLTTVYPNPFKDKLTVKYGKQIESIKIFNIVGEEVKSMELSATQEKTDIYFDDLSAGIYFIRTYKDKKVIETKKIVKTK
jgi:plastocyanin